MSRLFRPLLRLAPLAALSGCGPADTAAAPVGTFAGAGRDRLCIAGAAGAQRAGLIAFGRGDANCSVEGKLEPGAGGRGWQLVPSGEGGDAAACRIPLAIAARVVEVGAGPESCRYYCGPGATLGGQIFRAGAAGPASDLAGDRLC